MNADASSLSLPTSGRAIDTDAVQARRSARASLSARWHGWRPQVGQETLALWCSLYFSLACNGAWWRAFAAATDPGTWRTWLLGGALFGAVTLLQAAFVSLLFTRWTARPVAALLIVASAAAGYYMSEYTVYLDPDMLRNVLHTEAKESGELLTAGFVLHMLLAAGLPLVLLWRVRIVRRTWARAVLLRAGLLVGAVLASTLLVGATFKDTAALMRNHKEMRYLVTPGNLVASLVAVAADATAAGDQPRRVIGEDARALAPAGARPRLLVIVVGETVRAQNWGLNGYHRQTTPELAARDVYNFTDVSACGSSTEVSLPCMFSATGRRDYDEAEIKRSDSLLHVLERAGIRTLWRDNQTGCKGVCDGLAFESFLHADTPRFCDGERCLDEVLLDGLAARVGARPQDQVVVLHQLGNHGPSYFRRYPPAFRRFTPTCDTAELGDCAPAGIVNAYDNAILYTDTLLATTIDTLDAMTDYDTAMVYVSDHGESLGENGLYLHGVPYAIAPDVQLKVPMVLWLSPRWMQSRGVDRQCLRSRLDAPASHDNLFSTVLGLMQVGTRVYEPGLDLLAGCVAPPQALAVSVGRSGNR